MLFLLLCILFCCAYLLKFKRPQTTEPILPPTFYGKLPIIGHAHIAATLNTINAHEKLVSVAEYANKQGGVIYVKPGPLTCYVITDPEDAWTVANTCLQKPSVYDFFKNWLGQSLIPASGDVWQRHRKLLNPGFSLPVFHGFLEIFNSQAKQLIQNLEPFVGQAAFKASPYLKNFGLTVSCMTAFGTKDIKDKQFYSKYMNAVDEIMSIIVRRALKIWLWNDTLNKWLGERKREQELVETLRAMSDEVIKIRTSGNSPGSLAGVRYNPFIDILIEHLNNNNLNEQELKEEIDTIIAASYESSSELLEVSLLLLGSYSEVQDKVYKEIIEVCGNDGEVTKENLNKLVYTEAVIKECLRFIPVVPLFLRHVDKEVKLKNYTLRANTECILLVYGIHRSPSWGPDVNQFKPERWLDSSSTANNSKAFFAFSVGKRACVGKTYSIMSMKVVLSHVLRAFKITADHTKVKFRYGVILHMVEGNELRLQRRQSNKEGQHINAM